MKKLFIITVICTVVVGCTTSGRFSVVDLDLRSPEQTKAQIPEAEIVYTCTVNNSSTNEVKISSEVVDTLKDSFIVDIFKAVKGRLRVLSLEWKK